MTQRTLFFILMVLCSHRLALADDWPQWRGPDRTDISKETGLLPSWPPEGPKLLWTFREAGYGYSSMSVVGDRLYSLGAEDDEKEYVYAVDLKTQKKLWSTEVGPFFDDKEGWSGPRGTPTIDGAYLYAMGGHGDLVCVEKESGRKVWSLNLERSLGGNEPRYGYSESPLVDGDMLIVTPGGRKGTLAALNKKTGKLRWRSKTYTKGAWAASMIVIESSGVRQYVQVVHSTVFGVRASDGRLLWEFAGAGEINTPVYHNDCVYIADDGNCHLIKLLPNGDQFKAELIYHNREMRNDFGGVILLGEYVYGCNLGGGWVCQDFKTGKAVWRKGTKLGRGSVTYADGNLYGYHANKGDVLLIKATPTGYREQGRFRIPEESKLRVRRRDIYVHPVVANGKLYLRDHELIFCYDIHKLP